MRRLVLTVAVLTIAACGKSNSSSGSAAPPVRDPGAATGAIKGGAGPAGGAARGGAEGAAAPGAPSGPDDQYQIEAAAVSGTAGAETVARIVVRPGKGFHMNKEYPTKLALVLPTGVSAAKTTLEPADAEAFDDNQLAFAVKLTAAAAGEYSIGGTIKFAVCTESTCNPKKQTIALSLKAL